MELNKQMVLMVIEEYFKLHNYSENTFINIRKALNEFDRFLKIKDYRDVKEKDYHAFMEYLKDEKRIKKSTLKAELSTLRTVFKILEAEDKILTNPFSGIRPLKADYSIRDKILTKEEIKERLNYYDLKSPTGFRNRAIFEILYETGIRAGELTNLEIDDFAREEKLLFIRNGKGKQDRLVPLGEAAYSFLVKYVDKVRKKLVGRKRRKHLFVNRNGEKMSKWHLWEILNHAYRKGKITKKIHPHMLRHTCATELLKNGAGIREIQLLLGHKSIMSTQIYINLNCQHMAKEYEKYHALENELYFDAFEREAKVIKGELKNDKGLSKKGLTLKG